MKNLLCKLVIHKWRLYRNAEGEIKAECRRCGKIKEVLPLYVI